MNKMIVPREQMREELDYATRAYIQSMADGVPTPTSQRQSATKPNFDCQVGTDTALRLYSVPFAQLDVHHGNIEGGLL